MWLVIKDNDVIAEVETYKQGLNVIAAERAKDVDGNDNVHDYNVIIGG